MNCLGLAVDYSAYEISEFFTREGLMTGLSLYSPTCDDTFQANSGIVVCESNRQPMERWNWLLCFNHCNSGTGVRNRDYRDVIRGSQSREELRMKRTEVQLLMSTIRHAFLLSD